MGCGDGEAVEADEGISWGCSMSAPDLWVFCLGLGDTLGAREGPCVLSRRRGRRGRRVLYSRPGKYTGAHLKRAAWSEKLLWPIRSH